MARVASGRGCPVAGSEPDAPVIDEAALGQLLADLEADDVEEICALFVRDARDGVRAIRSALESGDADSAARPAHRLKSASGFVGANALSALCAEIEHLARTDRLDKAWSRIDLLSEEIERTSGQMALVIGRLAQLPADAGGFSPVRP
jgi:HPt (histidine-containing phosphotransfer) domain-containing protein